MRRKINESETNHKQNSGSGSHSMLNFQNCSKKKCNGLTYLACTTRWFRTSACLEKPMPMQDMYNHSGTSHDSNKVQNHGDATRTRMRRKVENRFGYREHSFERMRMHHPMVCTVYFCSTVLLHTHYNA
mmetsp:Transcript_7594/g.14505  ORF Transcript_7594/g.14505 Transcript_7594/m.14505 type:complete len:129 (+) Transcript_7594:980-1366(+)